jgi:autotransporter translocation and assembly factor TamB
LLPWIPFPIEKLTGLAQTDLKIYGDLKTPKVTGKIILPKGQCGFDKNSNTIGTGKLVIDLYTEKIDFKYNSSEKSNNKIKINGKILLKKFKPVYLFTHISGFIKGKTIQQVGSKYIGFANGKCFLNLKIKGNPKSPVVTGNLIPENIDLKIRGFSKEISINSGNIKINHNKIRLNKINMGLDGGKIKLNGNVLLSKNTWLKLNIIGNSISFSKYRVFSSELNPKLTLSGFLDNLNLNGKIDIIYGKYKQYFDVIKKIIAKRRFKENRENIWDIYPFIGDIKLNISLISSGELKVENNLADLDLDGFLSLKGTVRKPKLHGKITITSGTFKIPYLKGVYDVSDGGINFDKSKHPYLKLKGTTNIEDYLGEEKLINLKLFGPLNKINFSLSSFPHMNQGQIVMLLASGRTTAELRKQYHGSVKSGTGTTSTSYNPIDTYDQPIKQITGDFLTALVANPIKMVTKLDTFRFELGTESFQLKISKKFFRHGKIKGEFEVGLLGKNRQEGGIEIKLHDRITIDSKIRRYKPGINEYEYEDPIKGKIELKYKIKLKGTLRSVLGF